jgi:hypothetical protein
VIDGLDREARVGVIAKKAGFQLGKAVAVAGGDPIKIVLLPGLEIALRVVGSDGAPIAGAEVHLVRDPMSGWSRLGITRADGRFLAADLPAHAVDIVVQRHGYSTERRTVDAREAPGELVLTLVQGRTLRDQVVDGAGQPVAGASI